MRPPLSRLRPMNLEVDEPRTQAQAEAQQVADAPVNAPVADTAPVASKPAGGGLFGGLRQG